MLEIVKGTYPDTLSQDVLNHYGINRQRTELGRTTRDSIIDESKEKKGKKESFYTAYVSDSRGDDIQAFEEAGMDFNTFLKVQNEYSRLTEEDIKASERAEAFQKWVKGLGVNAKQQKVILEYFKFFSQIPASAKEQTGSKISLPGGKISLPTIKRLK